MAHVLLINDNVHVLRDDWYVEDIMGQCPELNERQAVEVMKRIAHSHNAEIGINWEVIEFWADKLYPELTPTEDLNEVANDYERKEIR